ncbi:hypothetical protein LJC11_02605 [Bacteroidales bacterium OttesenSCG-928-I21]|nr:hypothetical protein [Bacteroidales bacterium OttesenSCG-928-I21]
MKNTNRKNTFSASIHGLFENINDLIKLKTEYYTLTLAEKVSLLIARIVLILITTLLGLVLFSLLLILIHGVLMSWIGIFWAVALVEVGFVVLLLLFLWIFKDKLIIRPVSGMIIRDILDNNNDEE